MKIEVHIYDEASKQYDALLQFGKFADQINQVSKSFIINNSLVYILNKSDLWRLAAMKPDIIYVNYEASQSSLETFKLKCKTVVQM